MNLNIYDPRTWANLDTNSRDLLVKNGPIRDILVQKGPKDKLGRCFSSTFYTCLLYTSPSPRDRQKSRMPSSA